ncbi:MAG: hypothetical protein ABI959_09875 [Candidatus Dormiibacterota bacterium]
MPHARLFVVIAAVAVSATILVLTRGYTFYFDEWNFILTSRDWTATTYLQPHNGHPAMLTRIIYSVLLATLGLRSYLPYMAVLLALHATSAILIFELVRRRAGDLIGIATAALLLVIGAGWENLLWAFQMSFVGSVACGLGMLVALESSARWRMPIVAALLTASLMFSAIGLFFGLAAAVDLAATPERRKELVWLAPVAMVFVAWFLTFGLHSAQSTSASANSNLLALPLYTLWGLGASVAGLIGEGGWLGIPLLALGVWAVGHAWWRHGCDGLALGTAAGLVAFYLVTGVARGQIGYEQSGAGRYVYVGAVFWLILLGAAAGRLPWRGTWRPALVALLFLACFNSGAVLVEFGAAKAAQMQRQMADLEALDAVRDDRCLNESGAVDPLVMPDETNPARYYRATDRYGDPAAGLPVTDRADFDRARANLLKPGCN